LVLTPFVSGLTFGNRLRVGVCPPGTQRCREGICHHKFTQIGNVVGRGGGGDTRQSAMLSLPWPVNGYGLRQGRALNAGDSNARYAGTQAGTRFARVALLTVGSQYILILVRKGDVANGRQSNFRI
jgi:hypothetical protein